MNENDKHMIRDYVRGLLRDAGGNESLVDDESLFVSGRLSSFQMMMLVMYLEEKFDLDFGKLDFDTSLIDSVIDIEALVGNRGGAH